MTEHSEDDLPTLLRHWADEPPRGEGGDLAARTVQIIRNRAKIAREQGTTEAQIIRARALDEAANEFADILPALRSLTEGARKEVMKARELTAEEMAQFRSPTEGARVDPEDVAILEAKLDRGGYQDQREMDACDRLRANLRVLAALEPAPTDQPEVNDD